jgi:hypothetical protein
MTVGKVYASLLILENWRTTKFGRIQTAGLVVRSMTFFRPFRPLLRPLSLSLCDPLVSGYLHSTSRFEAMQAGSLSATYHA